MPALRTALALFAMTLATPALAVPTRAQLEEEVKIDKSELRDAERDLKKIERLQRKWEKARRNESGRALARVDGKLLDFTMDEIIENRAHREAARREFIAMGGDPAALDNDLSSRPQKIFTPKRALDDQDDFRRLRAHIRQVRTIHDELQGMQPAFDSGRAGPALYRAKSGLIEALVVSQRRDIKRAKRELLEDQEHLARR